MKKFISIFSLIFVLTGCASTHPKINTSSKCLYEVDGLSCEREQVWEMRDNSGTAYEHNYTHYWFDDYEECEEFVWNDANYDIVIANEGEPVHGCGASGKTGTSPSVMNYYVFDDGTKDGDFYYFINKGMGVIDKPGNKRRVATYKDWFQPVFTSREAVKTFQRDYEKKNRKTEQNFDRKDSIYNVYRLRIKRMY